MSEVDKCTDTIPKIDEPPGNSSEDSSDYSIISLQYDEDDAIIERGRYDSEFSTLDSVSDASNFALQTAYNHLKQRFLTLQDKYAKTDVKSVKLLRDELVILKRKYAFLEDEKNKLEIFLERLTKENLYKKHSKTSDDACDYQYFGAQPVRTRSRRGESYSCEMIPDAVRHDQCHEINRLLELKCFELEKLLRALDLQLTAHKERVAELEGGENVDNEHSIKEPFFKTPSLLQGSFSTDDDDEEKHMVVNLRVLLQDKDAELIDSKNQLRTLKACYQKTIEKVKKDLEEELRTEFELEKRALRRQQDQELVQLKNTISSINKDKQCFERKVTNLSTELTDIRVDLKQKTNDFDSLLQERTGQFSMVNGQPSLVTGPVASSMGPGTSEEWDMLNNLLSTCQQELTSLKKAVVRQQRIISILTNKKASEERGTTAMAIAKHTVATSTIDEYSTGLISPTTSAESMMASYQTSVDGFSIGVPKAVENEDPKFEATECDQQQKVESTAAKASAGSSSTSQFIFDPDGIIPVGSTPRSTPLQQPIPTDKIPGLVQFDNYIEEAMQTPNPSENNLLNFENSLSNYGAAAILPPSKQTCPCCNQTFVKLSFPEFEHHCSECLGPEPGDLDTLISENIDEDTVIITNPDLDEPSWAMKSPDTITDPETGGKICPVCQMVFESLIPQTMFDRHVNDHFHEDDTTTVGPSAPPISMNRTGNSKTKTKNFNRNS